MCNQFPDPGFLFALNSNMGPMLMGKAWTCSKMVSSRFAETRFAVIMVRGWCLPDSPKPNSPKLGFRVKVRVAFRRIGFRRNGFRRNGFRRNGFRRIGTEPRIAVNFSGTLNLIFSNQVLQIFF